MNQKEIEAHVEAIMNSLTTNKKKALLLATFVDQQQREAFVMGKAHAYKEMFSVIRKLAEDKAGPGGGPEPGA